MTAIRKLGVCSRRAFLAAIPGICAAASTAGKGSTSPPAAAKYPDPTTDLTVTRLTDPQYSSELPRHYARGLSRRDNFLIYASDAAGSMQAFRMDLKNGQSRQLTDAASLDPACLTLLGDERGFCYVDGGRLYSAALGSLRAREVYRVPEGFEAAGMSVTEDGVSALLVERSGLRHRIRLIRMADGMAASVAEADEEIRDPIPRPKRASVLYRRGGGLWLGNFDARQNYRLRLAEGESGPAVWSPDGRSVLYLNIPPDPRKLRNIREFTPDANEDKAVADTTQYAGFTCNADASVFVGASASKASPYVLLLVRAVKREFTLCEHRASDPAMVSPVFSHNSQRVFFTSDQHGKPAVYSVGLEKLVAETEEVPERK